MTILLRTSTNINIILYSVRQKLIADAVYPAITDVFLVTNTTKNIIQPTTNYCIIKPGKQDFVDYEAAIMGGTLEITLWVRYSVDEGNRTNIALTAQGGIEAQVNAVNISLDLFDLVYGSQWILIEPMRLLDVSEPETTDQWQKITLIYSIRYGYDPSVIAPQNNQFDEYTSEYTFEFV